MYISIYIYIIKNEFKNSIKILIFCIIIKYIVFIFIINKLISLNFYFFKKVNNNINKSQNINIIYFLRIYTFSMKIDKKKKVSS